MKTIGKFLALVMVAGWIGGAWFLAEKFAPAEAHAQFISAGGTLGVQSTAITSSVSSGAAFLCQAGGKVCLNAACTSYIYAPSGTDVQSPSRFTILGVNADDYFSGTTAAVKIKGGTADGASAVGVKIGNLSTLTTDGAVIAGFYNDTSFANLKASVRADGSYQYLGLPTASLPACNAAHEGTQQYDTTTKTMKFCNGTAWAGM